MNKYMLLYLIIINIITFIIFGLDKLLAVLNKNRISERVLLYLSIIGGCFLEFLSMFIFKHKIRKKKFYIVNIIFIIIYLVIIKLEILWNTIHINKIKY